MRRTGAVLCVAVLLAGCGFDSASSKQPSNLVAPVYSQPDLHRAQIDAARRQAADRDAFDDEAPGTARISSTRVGASLSSDPPTTTTRAHLGRTQPWEKTEFD
ncbi:MAG: hypothetical protein WD066_02320 [Planctomycetaceae bacterium]